MNQNALRHSPMRVSVSRVIAQLAVKHGVAADDANAMKKLKDGWLELLTPAPFRVANATTPSWRGTR